MTRRSGAALVLLPALALAGADGTVLNRTTGKPQAGATVTLFDLSKGMQPAASVKCDAQGRFRFDVDLSGPMLLQAAHQGVTYSRMIQAGAPAADQELAVYDAARSAPEAKLTQRLFLLEPGDGKLAVAESLFFENKGNLTLLNGGPRLYLPEESRGQARVMFQAPNSMPLQRQLCPAGKANTYRVDVPIKPGETRLDISYELPFQPGGKFASRLLEPAGVVRLAVPHGVTVKGDGIEALGEEPTSHAAIFEVKGDRLEVRIEGTGSLGGSAGQDPEEDGPGIQQILPRIYDRLYPVLGLSLAILTLGFLLLYRREVPRPPAPRAPAGKGAGRR